MSITTETIEEREARRQAERTAEICRGLASTVRVLTPPRYRGAEVDSLELAEAVADVADGKADGILLTGPTGVGKTHAAFASLAALCQQTKWLRTPRIEATTAPDMLARCRPGSQPVVERDEFGDAHVTDQIDWYAKAGVLLLDDLGAEKPSEWTGEVLYRIIDHRYNYERPTIVVSNLPPADLAKQIGDRLASRLTQMCRTVVIKGADRRRAR